MMENNTHPIEVSKPPAASCSRVYRIYYMKTGGVLMNADFLFICN